MAGIGPAIKTTGITGGTNNSAKPGDVNANKNNKLSALKFSNISDKEKAIEKGEDPDATAEVAKDDKQNTGSTTTKKDSAEKDAKKAVDAPSGREKLVSHIDEMNKSLQEFHKNNDGKIAEAQAFGQQAQANKDAQDLAKMMAAQQAQQQAQQTPKPSTPSPSQSKPSSNNSNNEAVKKLAEQQREVNAKQQEQMQKLAEALKKEKAKNDSPEEKLKDAQKALEAKKTKEAETDETKRSGSTDKTLEASNDKKSLSIESLMKLDKFVDEVKAEPRNSQKDAQVLEKLDLLAERTGDKNIQNIRDEFKTHLEEKPNSSVDETSVKEKNTRSDLEAYDDNSFSANIHDSRSEEVSQDLERDTDQTLNEVAKDSNELIEENQKEIEEAEQAQADQQAQAELEALLEEFETPDIDVEV